jgi:hypothetical protein
MSNKIHKKRSVNYQASLKQAIHSGDFEGIIKCVMLLGVKHNTEMNWQMSPRTFMELCTVLLKYRQEFGNNDDMSSLLSVLNGGKSDIEEDDTDNSDEDSEEEPRRKA